MTSKREPWLGMLGCWAVVAACAQDAPDSAMATQSSTADAAGERASAAARVRSASDEGSAASSGVVPRSAGAAARAASAAAVAGSGASPDAGAAARAASAGAGAGALAGAGPSANAGAGASVGASSASNAGAGAGAFAGAGAASNAGAGASTGVRSASNAGAGAAGAAGQTAAAGAGGVKPELWRITFLGDSITETTCTSLLVYDALHQAGQPHFDFVGTKQNQQGCGVDNPDRDVEGHSGYLVTDLVGRGPKASELPMWCAADKADLVLMHFGTNDAWNSGIPLESILEAYSVVIAKLREAQPRVVVFVAQIIPLQPDGCTDCPGRVQKLNAMIPMWASSQSTPESPIYVVDQWTGFDAGPDTNDRVHPNMQGARKMADRWLGALQAHQVF